MSQNTARGLAAKLMIAVLIAALAAPLAGCGRKSQPEHPEGSKFPRGHPANQSAPAAR